MLWLTGGQGSYRTSSYDQQHLGRWDSGHSGEHGRHGERGRKIARGGLDGPRGSADGATDLIEPILDLKLYERSVEASAQVVKVADETLGTLLDIRA